MTDRDRLIELVKQGNSNTPCEKDEYRSCAVTNRDACVCEGIADHLLANGVIVPPCKVGDIVYYPYEYGNKVLEKTVIKTVIEKEDRWLDVGVSFLPFENIGKTVFLTKAEAEQKLKELEK